MKKVLYISLIVLFSFSGCKKKTAKVRGCMDPKGTNYNASATEDDGSCTYPAPTPTPTPTMNYIKFNINGPGLVNRTVIFSKSKGGAFQRYYYSESTTGVIGGFIDFVSGDTTIQVEFDDNNTGNKPWTVGLPDVSFRLYTTITGFSLTSTNGSYIVKTFTPTHLQTNMSSGLIFGTFIIDATFSGTLLDDNLGVDTYQVTGGEIKFDGEM